MSFGDFFEGFIKVLNNNSVEYLLIGGHAVNYHGYVRATMDFDIWLYQTPENLVRFQKSLLELNYEAEKITHAIDEFQKAGIIKISKENYMLDVLGEKLIRLDFISAYSRREKAKIGEIELPVIGIDDLINCKLKSNREKDLLDVKELREIKKQSEQNL
jgi:predicted nucleotidyltransferase